jgi:hypothetical protein
VDNLSKLELQGLPRVIWKFLPLPEEQGSDSKWLAHNAAAHGQELDYIDAFQSHYKSLARPIAMAQARVWVYGPYTDCGVQRQQWSWWPEAVVCAVPTQSSSDMH